MNDVHRLNLDSIVRYSNVIDEFVVHSNDISIEYHQNAFSKTIDNDDEDKTSFDLPIFDDRRAIDRNAFRDFVFHASPLVNDFSTIPTKEKNIVRLFSSVRKRREKRTEIRSFSIVSVKDFSRSSSFLRKINVFLSVCSFRSFYFVRCFFVRSIRIRFQFV